MPEYFEAQYYSSSFASIFVNTKSANKTFLNYVVTYRYFLIEQSGNYASWKVALKFSALNCFEMHVVRERSLLLYSGNNNLPNLDFLAKAILRNQVHTWCKMCS